MNKKDQASARKFWIVNIITILILILLFLFIRSEKQALRESVTSAQVLPDAKAEIIPVKNELNVLFAGDIMLDRYIRKQINQNKSAENFVNNFLPNFQEENKKYDYVVANLEGPITENKSLTLNSDGTYGKDLLFTFPTSSVDVLKLLNIKAVSLANNHTDNFYRKGYEDTKKFLKEGNIKYFGNPYNEVDNIVDTVCQKDICVAYIGYNQFTKNNSSTLISEQIRKLKEDKRIDFVIVVPHWGDEYSLKSNKTQQSYAREWVEARADAVIGMHPHVVQENIIYKDKNIYYSIGNYIFDQWFSKEVSKGLVLNVKFAKETDQNGNVTKSLTIPDQKYIKISREKITYEP